jgi:hypothetical protein
MLLLESCLQTRITYCNIVTSVKSCAFVGSNCTKWIVLKGTENATFFSQELIYLPRQTQQVYILESAVKAKESRNRPGMAQRVPGGLGSQISWHSARQGGEVVSPTHRPPGMFLVLIFTRGWVDPRAMVRSEGNMSLKNPVTPPGIDPGTVRLVAQRLNHYATPGPRKVQ